MPFFSFIDLIADLRNRNGNSVSLKPVSDKPEDKKHSSFEELRKKLDNAKHRYAERTRRAKDPQAVLFSSNNRKLLSILCHGSLWLTWTFISIVIPIGIFFVSDDPIVKKNAKESLNAHLNILLCYFIFASLIFSVVGVPLLAVTALYHFVMPLVAIIMSIAKPAEAFEYPWTLPITNFRERNTTQIPTVIVIEKA